MLAHQQTQTTFEAIECFARVIEPSVVELIGDGEWVEYGDVIEVEDKGFIPPPLRKGSRILHSKKFEGIEVGMWLTLTFKVTPRNRIIKGILTHKSTPIERKAMLVSQLSKSARTQS